MALPCSCGVYHLACLFPRLHSCVSLWQVPEGVDSSLTHLVYVALSILNLYNLVILKEPTET